MSCPHLGSRVEKVVATVEEWWGKRDKDLKLHVPSLLSALITISGRNKIMKMFHIMPWNIFAFQITHNSFIYTATWLQLQTWSVWWVMPDYTGCQAKSSTDAHGGVQEFLMWHSFWSTPQNTHNLTQSDIFTNWRRSWPTCFAFAWSVHLSEVDVIR